MIEMSPAIVADSCAVFAHVFHQLFYAQLLQASLIFKGGIQVSYIGSMVAVVVDFHCERIEMRLKRIVGVGQGGKLECHG
jgi:hypothetical protein